jgi:hypothetical protein
MATMKLVPLALTVLCACVVADPDEGTELAQVEQALIPNCDDWGCGMNSPYVDSKGFHFLYKTFNQQNPEGFAITAFTKGLTPLTLNVVNGRITGTTSGGTVYGETGLTGAKLHISYLGQPMYRIMINGYESTFSWATNPTTDIGFRVKTYRLIWEDLKDPGKFYDMCSNPGVDDTLGMNEHHTIVFEGDVINADAKTIASTPNPNVINFGCAGGTLAKMHLTGHTYVANNYPGFQTTVPERQAMLKMLSADYCGTGKAYTVGGQPLTWADHKHWMQRAPNSSTEAHWQSWGATCLNRPRLAATDPVTYADLRNEINASCPQPLSTCPWVAPSGTHLISANPPQP